MAVARGTSGGFVSAKPSADPAGTASIFYDATDATRDTSPSGSYKITSLGFYQAATTNTAVTASIGHYSHDAANNRPNARQSNETISVGTNTSAWFWKDSLDLALVSSTTYWIAVGAEHKTNCIYCDRTDTTSADKTDERYLILPATWGATDYPFGNSVAAFCALYESAITDLSISMSECVGSTGHLA
jgi:hypothetical protein